MTAALVLSIVFLLVVLLLAIIEQKRAFDHGFALGKKQGFLEGRSSERAETGGTER